MTAPDPGRPPLAASTTVVMVEKWPRVCKAQRDKKVVDIEKLVAAIEIAESPDVPELGMLKDALINTQSSEEDAQGDLIGGLKLHVLAWRVALEQEDSKASELAREMLVDFVRMYTAKTFHTHRCVQ